MGGAGATWAAWVTLSAAWLATEAAACPAECACAVEESGLLATRCLAGGMRRVPVESMDGATQLVEIAPPPPPLAARPNALTIGPIFAHPRPFARLRELHIARSNVPSVGRLSFWGLRELRVLNLTQNNITALAPDDFRGPLGLLELHLDGNAIAEVPSETFRHLPALRELALRDNRMRAFVPRLFRALADLRRLDLAGNPLAELAPHVFVDVPALRTLSCRRCLLRRLDARTCGPPPRLEQLDLGDNLIDHLAADAFVRLPRLRTLRLDGNRLATVDGALAPLLALQTLSLARNRLSAFERRAFAGLVSLTRLDLRRNRLGSLRAETLAPLTASLRALDVGDNVLPPEQVAGLLRAVPGLHDLGLAGLRLERLPPDLLAPVRRLKALDLSRNLLDAFPHEALALDRVPFLQALDLSANRLRALPERALERMWAVARVDLAGNPWSCRECDVGPALAYLRDTALDRTLHHLKCAAPPNLRGEPLGLLRAGALPPCPPAAARALLSAAGAALLALAAGTAAYSCYRRRRSAAYYTREDERRRSDDRLVGGDVG